MAANEAVARLEAKLRGGTAELVSHQVAGKMLQSWIVRRPEHPTWPSSATDPYTPEGAWEWVRLANLHVHPGFDKGWQAIPHLKVAHTAPARIPYAADPIAAVAAVVEALAATGQATVGDAEEGRQ